MKVGGSASTTRTTLLEAASRVVLSEGVGALTLDAVARTAGVSKGGLLYHFKSKDALIIGMLDQLIEEFNESIAARLGAAAEEQGPGSWLRAYVEASFDRELTTSPVGAGILAAVASSPELLSRVRTQFAEWQRRALGDGIDPVIATLIRLAADGFFLTELLQLAPLDEPLRAQVTQALIRLTTKAP